eukprot:bmy_05945T0
MKDREGKEETFPPDLALTPGELTKLLLNKVSDNIPKADEIWTLASQTPGVCRQLRASWPFMRERKKALAEQAVSASRALRLLRATVMRSEYGNLTGSRSLTSQLFPLKSLMSRMGLGMTFIRMCLHSVPFRLNLTTHGPYEFTEKKKKNCQNLLSLILYLYPPPKLKPSGISTLNSTWLPSTSPKKSPEALGRCLFLSKVTAPQTHMNTFRIQTKSCLLSPLCPNIARQIIIDHSRF